MPQPVSVTRNRSRAGALDSGPIPGATASISTTTPPASVYLTALPSRLVRIARNALPSLDTVAGTSGATATSR